jgi:hypothetical protein
MVLGTATVAVLLTTQVHNKLTRANEYPCKDDVWSAVSIILRFVKLGNEHSISHCNSRLNLEADFYFSF